MPEFNFNPLESTPIVSAVISSPKGKRKVRLILDTGAERTQFHRRTMQRLGHTESVKSKDALAIGVGGAKEQGYMVKVPQLAFLGSIAENVELAVFDMSYLGDKNIDGLLGWDFIRLLHLEMNGPKGSLKVF